MSKATDDKLHNVDIVIPIYNAFDDLTLCLESLYKHTDLETNRLILINDNSPDERIKSFLDEQKLLGKNILVQHNESNKGFSANVNYGMQQSEVNDVILLNSDTVLTDKWVEKIVRCAYSDISIGTVTPLSNNATLCSVPQIFEENILEDGTSVDDMAEIVDRVSFHKYPRISVANGFCMFIKREVIETIGYFDAETFGRGYGEENDFCNRAEQAGYYNAMCDDTYIYHSGTKSFMSAEKYALFQAHDNILRERYPAQMHLNDVYVRDNINSEIGDNLRVYTALNNGRINILYLVQSDFREDAEDHIGGTQFHVKQLTESLKGKSNVFVAAMNGSCLNLTVYIDDKIYSYRYAMVKRESFYSFRNSKFEYIWEQIIEAYKIDVVHIQHVISTSFDLFYVAKRMGIPLYCTLHDFFYICQSEKLLDENNKVCFGCGKTDSDCRKCLRNQKGISEGISYIDKWRKECINALSLCDRLFTPNITGKDIYLSYYPELEGKIQVVEHGYDLQRLDIKYELTSSDTVEYYVEGCEETLYGYSVYGWSRMRDSRCEGGRIWIEVSTNYKKVLLSTSQNYRPDADESFNAGFRVEIPYTITGGNKALVIVIIEKDGCMLAGKKTYELPAINRNDGNKSKLLAPKNDDSRLNVAFIGGINDAKGGSLIADIIASSKEKVNWYVFGGIGSEKLAKLEQKNLQKTGWYDSRTLMNMMKYNNIDVVGILSIWPETYSYTMTESILCNVPVIVTDIGALGKRIADNGCGWSISLDNAVEEFSILIKKLCKDDSELNKKKSEIRENRFSTEAENADRYYDIYVEGVKNSKRSYDNSSVKVDYEYLYNGKCGVAQSFIDATQGRGVSIIEYNRVANENQHIKNSVAYRFSQKLISAKIPGKYFFYSIVKKFMK